MGFFVSWVIVLSFLLSLGGFIVRWLSAGHKDSKKTNKPWYLQVALSAEDAFAQWFILVGIFFVAFGIFALIRDLSIPVSWLTTFFIVASVACVISFYTRALYAFLVSIMALFLWFFVGLEKWGDIGTLSVKSITAVSCTFFIALIFFLVGRLLRDDDRYLRLSICLRAFGLVFVTLALFTLSSKAGLESFESATKGVIFFGSWQITIAVGVLALLVVSSFLAALQKKVLYSYEAIIAAFLGILAALMLFVPAQTLFLSTAGAQNAFTVSGFIWASFFNAVLLALLLGSIVTGYLHNKRWLINLGIGFTLLFALLKYFDFFFSFIERSLILIVSGLLFLTLGLLMEWGRRALLAKMAKTTQEL